MTDGLRHPNDDEVLARPDSNEALHETGSTTRADRRESYEWGIARGQNQAWERLYDTFGTSSVEKIAGRFAAGESIVRALAASPNPAHIDDGPLSPVCCDFCDACPPETGELDDAGNPYHRASTFEDHEVICVWRRAVEWVAAHPGADGA